MGTKLDVSDLNILEKGCMRLVSPINEADIPCVRSIEDNFTIKMRMTEELLDELSSKPGCLEIIKKNYSDHDTKEVIELRDIPCYKTRSAWHRYFLNFLPRLVEHILELPSGCTYSVQVEVVRALCRERGYIGFDNFEGLKPFWRDPNLFFALHSTELCEQIRIFINGFVKDLYLRLKEPTTRKQIRSARKSARRRTKDFQEYVRRLLKARTPINVIRIDLGYQRQYGASIETIIEDLEHLHDNMRHNDTLFKHRLGYIEKIEYGLSKGIHVHVLLFFSSERKSSANVHLAKSIGEYWVNEITRGHGHYWNMNAFEDYYRSLGRLGIGEIHAHDENGIRCLLFDVEYLCKVAQFIKPEANPKMKLIRRGAMPSKVKHSRPRYFPDAMILDGNTPGRFPRLQPTHLPRPNEFRWPKPLKINMDI